MRRKLIAGTIGVLTVIGTIAAPASAHVTVNPKTADQGSYSKLTFRVPNERPNAQTTKLEIAIPTNNPIASISVQPQPGWSYVVEKSALNQPVTVHGTPLNEVVSKIVWTADPNFAIKAGEFGEFNVSAGPLPKDTTSIAFKALQTYSNGEVVRWIDVAESGTEVEHPAPVLALNAAPAATENNGSTMTAVYEDEKGENDDETNVLAIVAIVISVLATAISLGALFTRKR